MLYTLLTLMPPRATPFELEFHEQFVLRVYREYYQTVVGTGFRDHKVLARIKEQTSYSMSMLLWRKPTLWVRISRSHRQLSRLKRSVIPLGDVSKLLKTP